MIEKRFIPYSGPDARALPTSENHLQFKWVDTCGIVVFSCSRQGNGMSCHYTADKNGNKRIKKAIGEFTEFVFAVWPWCNMIIAKIRKKTVAMIVEQCGFDFLIKIGDTTVYIMPRTVRGDI